MPPAYITSARARLDPIWEVPLKTSRSLVLKLPDVGGLPSHTSIFGKTLVTLRPHPPPTLLVLASLLRLVKRLLHP